MRLLATIPRRLTPVSLAFAVLALLVPSGFLARRSDWLLAALVLLSALGIPWRELAGLRAHARVVAFLSISPLSVLAALAWLLSRAFDGGVRDGLLATGLASSEVATVGLVALAGADAAIALGVVAGSLVVAAVLGPLAIAAIGGAGAHANGAKLLGRFALVVIAPLVLGVALRSARPGLERHDEAREGAAALVVAVLVYAALSGAHGAHHLGSALLASALFLAGSALLAAVWLRVGGRGREGAGATAVPGAFTIAMRDFAVAAALATQAFGAGAGTVPGIYGVLMLVAGSATASRLRRAARVGNGAERIS